MKNVSIKTLLTLTFVGLCLSTEIFAQAPGDWPQWRGQNRDGISKETGLLKEWPEGGPALVCSEIGTVARNSSPSPVVASIPWGYAVTVNT